MSLVAARPERKGLCDVLARSPYFQVEKVSRTLAKLVSMTNRSVACLNPFAELKGIHRYLSRSRHLDAARDLVSGVKEDLVVERSHLAKWDLGQCIAVVELEDMLACD
jgi:hypothetical protein